MPNTYTQIHIHFVFAVKYRMALIKSEWKDELYKFITGIFRVNGHKMLQINGVEDHIHIFVGLNPEQSISSLIQNVKTGSSKWINKKRFCPVRFSWQEGYGAFSYSKSQVSSVVRYISNQEKHHQKTTFINEYKKFLMVFEVPYDDKYIFKCPE